MARSIHGRRTRRGLAALALAASLAAPSIAGAQPKRTFYLDRLQMAGAPDDGVGVWRPEMREKVRFFGQLGLGFSLNPFRVENYSDYDDQAKILQEQNGHPVPLQLTTYLNAGVEIFERFSFQVSFPLAVYQGKSSLYNPDANLLVTVDAKPVVPMDLRLDARGVIFRSDDKAFKLGAIASLWLPTGNAFSWGGDGTVTGAVGLAAEYDAKVVAVTVNAGAHFRPDVDLNTFHLSHELTYGLGVFAPLLDERLRLGAEVTGSLGLGRGTTGDVDNTPIEARVEGRYALGERRRLWVSASGGTRLSAGYAPDFRGIAMFGGWVPLFDTEPKQKDFVYVIPGDTDKDKIPDDIDMCPNDMEDGKGVNPDDGCPELLNDMDSDGVPDTQDACPHEPGTKDADPKKNGCPEFIRRKKDSDLIEVLQEVQFAFDRADLLPPAFPILNEVVRLLKVNPDIEHVRIEGHTDDFGSNKYNDDLSQNRAESVMRYLVERGIAADRLEAKGFGKRRPIVDNSTPEGRQKNRRVEFHIVKTKGAVPVQGTPGTGDSNTPPPAGTGTPPPAGTGAPPPAGTGAPPPAGTGAPPPAGTGAPPPAGTSAPPPAGSGAPSAPPKPGSTSAAVAPAAPTAAKPAGSAAPSAAPAAPPKPAGSTAPSAAPAAPPKPSTSTAPAAPPH